MAKGEDSWAWICGSDVQARRCHTGKNSCPEEKPQSIMVARQALRAASASSGYQLGDLG